MKVEDLTAAYAARYPLAEARVRAELDIAKAEGKAASLTLDELTALGATVRDDGTVYPLGPTVGALIAEYGAILPDSATESRTSKAAMAEDLARFAERHEQSTLDRKAAGDWERYRDANIEAARKGAEQFGWSADEELRYRLGDDVRRLKAAGKEPEAEALMRALKVGDAQVKGAPQSTQEKVAAALAVQAAGEKD